MWSSGRFEMSAELAHHADLPLPVDVRPMGNARRLRLRYDERRGVLKLTCPARMSRKQALAWAAEQREWVETQVHAASERELLADGAVSPFEGRDMRLRWHSDAPRGGHIEGDQISCGGPQEGF